jgi:hypothetical protein
MWGGLVVRTNHYAAERGTTSGLRRRGQNAVYRQQHEHKNRWENEQAFHSLRLLPRVRAFLPRRKANWASRAAFRTFSLDLGDSSFDGVSFFVTQGVPAFSDRSAGADFLVDPRVAFQHAAKIAKFERTLPCNPR